MGDTQLIESTPEATDDLDSFQRSVRFGLGLAGLFLSTVVATLAVLAVAGTVLPRHNSTVVASGSMEPALQRGDTVVYSEQPIDEVGVGNIVVFDNNGVSTIHRVRTINDDGTLTTKGDANRRDDATPVTADELHGNGRMVVPWVGLIRLWWLDGRHALVIATVFGMLVAFRSTRMASDPENDVWAHGESASATPWLAIPAPTATPSLLTPSTRQTILELSMLHRHA